MFGQPPPWVDGYPGGDSMTIDVVSIVFRGVGFDVTG